MESTVLFPKNKKIPIRIRFNLLKNIEEFVNIHLMNAKGREIEKRIVGDKLLFFWESIELKCTKYNYDFKYTGIDKQKYYGYWDIIFLKEQWDNEHFIIILKAIQTFKLELNQIEEEFKII